MRIETVAVGQPRVVPWLGRDVRTSIFKSPVGGRVAVRRHNVEGDAQSDRKVHGGEYKALYAYAAEDYAWWKESLGRDLDPASFGENLTISDFDAQAVSIGDVFRMGDAELEAAAPRLPCSKLGLRFGDPHMVKTFAGARRWGIYFRIVKEGSLRAGDGGERIHADPAGVPVYEIARVHLADRGDRDALERLVRHDRLDPSWRSHFAERLAGTR
ncbi:MAG TPA: MOSC domain-containing protein [Thermoanaerobaculia bacterium]